jgi:hypothetical protein
VPLHIDAQCQIARLVAHPLVCAALQHNADQILVLYAKGLSTRDIVAAFKEMYDTDISAGLVSKVTECVIEQVHEWQNRPRDMHNDTMLQSTRPRGARPAATFYLRAEGESMTGVGIFPGDLLVVDKSLTPRHGDVVIALLDGGFTVKTLQLKPRLRLLPANPAFAPIDPCMSLSLELFGVVTHVIGNLRQRDGYSAR